MQYISSLLIDVIGLENFGSFLSNVRRKKIGAEISGEEAEAIINRVKLLSEEEIENGENLLYRNEDEFEEEISIPVFIGERFLIVYDAKKPSVYPLEEI
ncbi:hypothetical protein [Serratia phage SMP]|uniref:Uncharacterized protein n=1 Tax=Serratia phage SMP TaxID=2982904 RepID=A0A9E8JUL7_9CAUD|nr:hypothetical protein [Serratia phage SMP]